VVVADLGAPGRFLIAGEIEQGLPLNDADVLADCRQPGVHVRGCWALELLLEKE
jgi:hypothetical protein